MVGYGNTCKPPRTYWKNHYFVAFLFVNFFFQKKSNKSQKCQKSLRRRNMGPTYLKCPRKCTKIEIPPFLSNRNLLCFAFFFLAKKRNKKQKTKKRNKKSVRVGFFQTSQSYFPRDTKPALKNARLCACPLFFIKQKTALLFFLQKRKKRKSVEVGFFKILSPASQGTPSLPWRRMLVLFSHQPLSCHQGSFRWAPCLWRKTWHWEVSHILNAAKPLNPFIQKDLQWLSFLLSSVALFHSFHNIVYPAHKLRLTPDGCQEVSVVVHQNMFLFFLQKKENAIWSLSLSCSCLHTFDGVSE